MKGPASLLIVLPMRYGGKNNYERLANGRDRHRKNSMKIETPSRKIK